MSIPRNSTNSRPWLASLLLFLSLATLRLALVSHWNIDFATACKLSLPVGLYFDAVSLLLPASVAYFFRSFPRLNFIVWATLALVLWFSNLANLLHFRFFNTPLDWTVLTSHAQDVTSLRGEILRLSRSFSVIVSTVLFVLSLITKKSTSSTPPSFRKQVVGGLALITAFLLLRQVVTMFALDRFFAGPTFGRFVLKDWWDEALKERKLHQASVGPCRGTNEIKEKARLAAAQLTYWRDHNDATLLTTIPHHDSAELFTGLPTGSLQTQRIRTQLGLPKSGPINIIILFVESLRTFELNHPEIGPIIFPRLRKLFKEHSQYFSQAYSSARITVEGEFSGLCSFFPKFQGAAVYYSNPDYTGVCAPELFSNHGYETLHLMSYGKGFDNTFRFGSAHGISTFYDHDYFYGVGIHETVGEWGLADKPFLQQALKVLEGVDKRKKNFLATMLTMSSHVPWSKLAGFPLPSDLEAATQGLTDYQGYLSTLRYVDEALGDFFHSLFESPMAERTAVVLLGDHSVPVLPHVKLSDIQSVELRSRIPIAVITKSPKTPRSISIPVHQIDVAPTVASIAGLSDKTTWIGHNLLSERQGTDWVRLEAAGISYRRKSRGCYALMGKESPICIAIGTAQDPLYSTSLKEITGTKQEQAFFASLVESVGAAFAFNCLKN